MAANFDEHPVWHASDGTRLVGGSVYYGVRNADPKTNPITIYSDREFTTTLLNPQPTLSDGRTENKVWIDGRYSIQVDDSLGNQIYQELDAGTSAGAGTPSLTELETTADSPYTLTAFDNGKMFVIDATNGAFTFNLLAAINAGSEFEFGIKVSSADTSANIITVDPDGAELVDGKTSLTMNQTGQAFFFRSTGSASTSSQWYTVGDVLNVFNTITLQGTTTDGDAFVRLNSTDVQGSYTEVKDIAPNQGVLTKSYDGGNVFFDIDSIPTDGAGISSIRYNRFTNTTGTVQVSYLRGNASSTADHTIKSGTAGDLVQMCINGGTMSVAGSQVQTADDLAANRLVAKALLVCGALGNIQKSTNIASIVDVGIGEVDVNFTTAFADVNYAALLTLDVSPGSARTPTNEIVSTSSLTMFSANAGGSQTDPSGYSLVVFGD